MHIEQHSGSWSFEGISENFEEHARRSIPFYDVGHDLVLKYSDFFCSGDQSIVDLGCSTGLLLRKLAERHQSKPELKFFGVEAIEDMAEYADNSTSDERVTIKHQQIEGFEFPSSNLITSYYTMQFVPPAIRQNIINTIYESLEWGGALIMFEKVRACDARFQDYASQTYLDFKIDNDFKESEIVNKSRSLKGVMEPFSTQGNIDLMSRAGFNDIQTVFKWVCFEGFLAIK